MCCKYSILAESAHATIRYCHHCNTYSLLYNNVVMNFEIAGFERFKDNLVRCYEHNTKNHCIVHRKVRDIVFNTSLEGLQLLFSTEEVGELLSLIQEAQLNEVFVETDP
ncbi:MAG: DUF6686 family protein [Bacteroidota bacterium]